MRYIFVLLFLAGCSPHKTNLERMADEFNACRRMHGVPTVVKEPFWGDVVKCEIKP